MCPGEITEEELLTRLQQVKDGGPRPATGTAPNGASASASPSDSPSASTSDGGVGSSDERRPEAAGEELYPSM